MYSFLLYSSDLVMLVYTFFFISFPLWFMEATEIIMPNYLDKTNKNLSKRKGQIKIFFLDPHKSLWKNASSQKETREMLERKKAECLSWNMGVPLTSPGAEKGRLNDRQMKKVQVEINLKQMTEWTKHFSSFGAKIWLHSCICGQIDV